MALPAAGSVRASCCSPPFHCHFPCAVRLGHGTSTAPIPRAGRASSVERLDEVPVAVGQGPQPGAHLRDDRVDVACADLELLAGGKHVSTLDPL